MSFLLSDGSPLSYGLLSDREIREYVKISPFSENHKRLGVISFGVSSYGYDLRLGNKFKVFSPLHASLVIDPKNMDERCYQHFEGDHCVIPPNSYMLGESVETIEVPRDVIGITVGKSTYARAGIIVNVTPAEPSWRGKLTIEISNSAPLPAKVYAGEGIAQMMFFRAGRRCETSYADKQGIYQDQTGVTPARVRQ